MEKPKQENSRRSRPATDLFSGSNPDPEPPQGNRDQSPGPLMRPDGQRACAVCGAAALFGFGVKLLAGQPGRWSCHAHRQAVRDSSPR